MKSVVITGVSTGLGRATAEDLAAHDYHVFGSVRREKDAAEIQAKLGKSFTPLLFDVTDEAAIRAAADKVAAILNAQGQGLTGLINNAGMSLNGPLMHIPVSKLRQQFEVNVLGLVAVTQTFLPLLGAKLPQRYPPGRIINISSVGGRIAFPFIGAYAACKHAIEGLSDSLRRELLIYGVDVIVLEPGSVKTAIWDKAEQEDLSMYANTDYMEIMRGFQKAMLEMGRAGVAPEVVSRTIREALESVHPKTRYALPDNYIMTWLLPRFLPDRWLDRIIASRVGLKRKQ
jgi:NAD(P)-dependent dehydrogenase (short-subunit alcohol dehydrogenase family)